MIYFVGITLTSFLVIILSTKKNKSISDKILFVWLTIILLHLGLFSIISSKGYPGFHLLLGFEIPLPLLHGPFLFLYTRSLTTGWVNKWNKLLHFIPFTLAFLSIIPFLFLEKEDKIKVYQNEGGDYAALTTIIFISIIFSGLTYSLLSLRSVLKHKRIIRDNYTYIEKINLEWLYRLIIGLMCIWVMVLVANDEFIFSAVVLYVLFIGYYGIKQVGIFTNPPPHVMSAHSESAESTIKIQDEIIVDSSKYEKSTLGDKQIESIHSELQCVMKKKKLYLTPELTLQMVSQELNVHPNYLSQVINTVERKNFFDYINTLRVDEFKQLVLITENQKYTLLTLAYECGFNSKTSFNRNFRKINGNSPTDYLKTIKVQLEK